MLVKCWKVTCKYGRNFKNKECSVFFWGERKRKQKKNEKKKNFPAVLLQGPTMHCAKQLRLFVEREDMCKMSTGKFKQFEQCCSGSNQGSLRISHLESHAVFRRFSSSGFNSKMPSRSVCSLTFFVSTRDGSSQEECCLSCLQPTALIGRLCKDCLEGYIREVLL